MSTEIQRYMFLVDMYANIQPLRMGFFSVDLFVHLYDIWFSFFYLVYSVQWNNSWIRINVQLLEMLIFNNWFVIANGVEKRDNFK